MANQLRIMRDLIAFTIADQEDVEIVGQIEDVAELPDLAEETRPDCVIISLELGKRPHICGTVPIYNVIVVAYNSNSSFLYY